MNDPELHEESDDDTSDDDYVPGGKSEDVPSEVDSDGDPEDALSDSEILDDKKSRKRKKSSAPQKRHKISHEPAIENQNELSPLTEEEKKKKDDDLWSDFMKDTGFQSKKSLSQNSITKSVPPTKSQSEHNPNKADISTNKPVEKVKITQIFEFAGEEVKVEKEVAANSAEARLLDNKATSATNSKPNRAVKRGGLSGIGSVLSQLGKKQKISTLEKTKLDWDQFKKDENLEEELQTHNKGKDGYLERQDFLQRADLRRFEIEKEIRTVERNRRMTN